MKQIKETPTVPRERDLTLNGTPRPRFPSTRYQGSKAKLVDWIRESMAQLHFDSALDLFGGTGCVAHMLKRRGKVVTYNDALRSNYMMGAALIENSGVTLSGADIDYLVLRHKGTRYPSFIEETFAGIYYTDEENRWLDMVVANIRELDDVCKQRLAFFTLFQASIVKRPFNLFHRANLYLRLQDVQRNFGNKASWDKPFGEWFRHFVDEANAAVFDNGRKNRATNLDWRDTDASFDLVYIDTPYMSERGISVDFLDFYHFLEGLARYDEWPTLIDWRRKHRPIRHQKPAWSDPLRIHDEFDGVLRRFADSTLVVSYRSNGIPTIDELVAMMKKYKPGQVLVKRRDYQYVLSPRKGTEVLLVAE